MDFGEAVEHLEIGGKVGREDWNGGDMWLELQKTEKNSKMTLLYISMLTAQGDLAPWFASQTDLLSEDWEIVE